VARSALSEGAVRPDRRSLLPPLAEDADLAPVGDIDVLERQPGQLGESDPRVVKDPYDRGIASILEPAPLTRGDETARASLRLV
jgi:hypothetical protein